MFKIEIAKEKDLEAYRSLRRIAITGKDKEMFGSTPEMIAEEVARPEKEWVEDITATDKFIVLAFEADDPIGMGSVIKKEDEKWYMRSLYVKEDHRDSGIGKQIVRVGLEEISNRQGKKVSAHVRNENVRSRSIFRSFGFKKTEDDLAGVGYFIELTL